MMMLQSGIAFLSVTVVLIYAQTDDSCRGRCGSGLDSSKSCQCNDACIRFNDCCSDYLDICSATSTPDSISDAELRDMGDIIWAADNHRFSGSQLVVNKQRMTYFADTGDRASDVLFSYVDAAKLAEPSYSLFIGLLDNYNVKTRELEPPLSAEEVLETEAYLNYVLSTDVMIETARFLISKGVITSYADMKSLLRDMWFSLYPRSSSLGFSDSSGFEHVFVGETKPTSVTGFHNWVQMYLLETSGRLNYLGYNYIAEPNLMDNRFTWNGLEKARASMFIGTSPEFEMALYTLCFVARPGSVCRTSILGHTVYLQTYDVSHVPNLQVATAFPMVNGL